jgi:hypothetical protein
VREPCCKRRSLNEITCVVRGVTGETIVANDVIRLVAFLLRFYRSIQRQIVRFAKVLFRECRKDDLRTFSRLLDDRSQGYVWKVIEISQLLSFCWLLRRSGNTEDKKPESPAAKICSSTIPRGVRCSEATNGKVPLYLSSIVKSRSS